VRRLFISKSSSYSPLTDAVAKPEALTEDLMQTIFETDRILVREWNPSEDAEQAFTIYGDPEVMHFIRSADESVEIVRQNLENRTTQYKQLDNGTGFWAIVDRSMNEIVGSVLLKQLPDNDGNLTQEYEVGWHLKKSVWGKGYATEAGRIALDYGFQVLKLPIIYAVVKPENQTSIRVTQRLGMKPIGQVNRYYGVELEMFELKAEEFLSQ
jgi:ribosomal-protein-alanine N-acetyltransferase